MTAPWLNPLTDGAHIRKAVTAGVPTLTTERLILRVPRIEDWPALEHIWTTKRGEFIGGPYNGEDAWLDFNQAIAGWILRGIGAVTIVDRETGAVLGLSGFFLDYGDSILELGWLLTQDAEGKGIAYEAACALRDFAFDTLPTTEFVSFVNVKNTRSVSLAERLGTHRDPEPLADSEGGLTYVFRHRPAGRALPDDSPTKSRHKSDSEIGGSK